MRPQKKTAVKTKAQRRRYCKSKSAVLGGVRGRAAGKMCVCIVLGRVHSLLIVEVKRYIFCLVCYIDTSDIPWKFPVRSATFLGN